MEAKEKLERREFRESLLRWVKESCPDWKDEQVVKDWLQDLPSERTRENAKRDFVYFLGFVKMSPTEIYNKRLEDLDNKDPKSRNCFERETILFKNALSEHHYKKSSIISLLDRVQSFFAHNDMALSFRKGALKVEVSDIVKMERKPKQPPTNTDIRLMYADADIKDRLLLLFGYQIGLLPADISRLRIEQIPINEDTSTDDFIYYELPREKTDIPIRTALNPELIHDYKTLLRLRGYPKKGWVFETREETRLQENHISEAVKKMAFRSLESERAKRFKFKDLRDAFNEALLESKIPQEFKDVMMGHRRKGAREAYSMSNKSVVETYAQVFRLLSINHWKQSKSDMDEVKTLFLEIVKINMIEDANQRIKENIKFIERLMGLKPNELLDAFMVGSLSRQQLNDMIERRLTKFLPEL